MVKEAICVIKVNLPSQIVNKIISPLNNTLLMGTALFSATLLSCLGKSPRRPIAKNILLVANICDNKTPSMAVVPVTIMIVSTTGVVITAALEKRGVLLALIPSAPIAPKATKAIKLYRMIELINVMIIARGIVV